jgi:hypothetical protein
MVAVFFAVWGTTTAAVLGWRARGSETLADAAARLDRQADMHDQVKTAYWFIRHPSPSDWIDVQIRRTAQDAKRINIDSVFRYPVPKAFYRASALLLVLLLLNFLPQSLDHNWLYLQGARPFRLSRADRAAADRAKKLLENTEAAKELEQIVSDLQQGKISSSAAQKELADLQQQIDGGNLELNNILSGLTAMANQLGQSPALASTAQAMAEGNPGEAAEQIRSLAEKLGMTPDEVLREMQKNMSQAAANSPVALHDLSKPMQEAADALKSQDNESEKAAFDDLAKALDQLARTMNSQQQQSQASRQLADLKNSLQQEAAAADAASNAQSAQTSSQGDSGEGGGDPSANGKTQAGNPSGSGQGSQSGGPSGSSASGSAENLKPEQITKLEVQLKMEGLRGQGGKGGELQDVEEASRQERSAMDYRNVPSQLSPAQKDALNQNRLPREQREIVKYYFEEIRPQTTKAAK